MEKYLQTEKAWFAHTQNFFAKSKKNFVHRIARPPKTWYTNAA